MHAQVACEHKRASGDVPQTYNGDHLPRTKHAGGAAAARKSDNTDARPAMHAPVACEHKRASSNTRHEQTTVVPRTKHAGDVAAATKNERTVSSKMTHELAADVEPPAPRRRANAKAPCKTKGTANTQHGPGAHGHRPPQPQPPQLDWSAMSALYEIADDEHIQVATQKAHTTLKHKHVCTCRHDNTATRRTFVPTMCEGAGCTKKAGSAATLCHWKQACTKQDIPHVYCPECIKKQRAHNGSACKSWHQLNNAPTKRTRKAPLAQAPRTPHTLPRTAAKRLATDQPRLPTEDLAQLVSVMDIRQIIADIAQVKQTMIDTMDIRQMISDVAQLKQAMIDMKALMIGTRQCAAEKKND